METRKCISDKKEEVTELGDGLKWKAVNKRVGQNQITPSLSSG